MSARTTHQSLLPPLRTAGATALVAGLLAPAAGSAAGESDSPTAPAPTLTRSMSPAATRAIPPEPVDADIKPVVETASPSLQLVLRTGASDGAVTTESGKGKTRATLNSAVTFETDSATLTPRATEVLDGIVSGWGGTPPASMAVVGHADSVADDAHNQTLSEQRARAVADYLTSKEPSLKVEASGKGETQPVAGESNDNGSVNEAGRAANRRVELTWDQ